MLDKFAEELREAREKSGISLQQMAMKTRVDIKYLEAIDKGDFAFLPEPYVKAFLKDYAKIVGLDENKTIQKYETAKKGKSLEEKEEVSSESIEEKPVEQKKIHTYDATPPKPPEGQGSNFNRNIIFNGLIILGIIIALIFLYNIIFNDTNEIIVAEKPIEEIIESNQRFEEPKQNEVEKTKPSDSLNLTILASDTSWVQIISDGKRLEEFTLFPNSQKTIKTGKDFKIILGNSGVIKFRLNNQPLDYSNEAGSVSYVQITKNGLTRLQKPPALDSDE